MMRTHRQAVELQIDMLIAVFIAVVVYLIIPIELFAQTKNGLQMKMSGSDSSQVSAAATDGVPERGRFELVYSYSGEPISPDINISVNGSQVVDLGSLAPVVNDTLVNRDLAKGDNVNMYASFGIAEATIFLHTGLVGYSPGFWAGWGSITFYEYDPVDGSIIQVYGTMNYEYYHRPPWNGIEVTAEPEQLMAGEASDITLQPYEAPGEPVIVPDITYMNLQTSLLGDLIGGLSLPEFGYRYTKGFNNAPWGLLKDTDILYEVDPSIETSDPLGIPIVAYSPYDLSKFGSTVVEVGEKEEELDLTLAFKAGRQAWPTLTEAYGGNPNDNNILKGISVQVLKGGEPAKNQEVKISTSMILPSGGHMHTNQPTDLGTIKDLNSGNAGNGSIVSKTNNQGFIPLEYTTNPFGGLVQFSAVHTSAIGVSDSDSILVAVPGLVQMPQSSFYVLEGQTDLHVDNHWITAEARISLVEGAKIFYQGDWNTNEEKMILNDLSLPYGGLFDIDPNWEPPHKSHRIGRDIDIENITRIAELKAILEKRGWEYIPEGKNFFPHFRY